MQPDTRKLPQDANINDKVETKTDSCLDNWKSIATTYDELQYVEYIMYDRQRQNMHHVVLGDDEHQAEHADGQRHAPPRCRPGPKFCLVINDHRLSNDAINFFLLITLQRSVSR